MIWNYVNSSGTMVQELDTEVSGATRIGTERKLTWLTGRVEAAEVTDEEAGDCHRAGFEVSADGRSRYSPGLSGLHLFTNESTKLRPTIARRDHTDAEERLFVIPLELCLR